jgi:hypothetical protein
MSASIIAMEHWGTPLTSELRTALLGGCTFTVRPFSEGGVLAVWSRRRYLTSLLGGCTSTARLSLAV